MAAQDFQTGAASVYPLALFTGNAAAGASAYLDDPATRILLEFFESKGLAALKAEDRREAWYEDWLRVQAEHGLYAQVLSPAAFSSRGGHFDLLRYARFLEVFAWCSPAHGYSLQVTFLGLSAVLMGSNDALKREAVRGLENGELLAFGVSERAHGSDLMANEFQVGRDAAGQWIANGSKYYIGNANAASIIATLGREREADSPKGARGARGPFILAALRPKKEKGAWAEEKIPTLGVRTAHVGAFTVKDYPLPEADIIARGREAWDAVFGTVTLGKFFLGFGAIGICEHALHEAAAHLRKRTLYGAPALEMPHLRAMMSQAYARLLAMKLYAYRALDYVHAASEQERRYQLFCAVQKARVSTEGVKVMALLSECIGAKGFEADTYCEMALRDAALFPGLEGSMHINLGLAVQFLPRYFKRTLAPLARPPSLLAGETESRENPYLMAARTGGTHAIEFAWFIDAYRPFVGVPAVAMFVRQAAAFRRFVQEEAKQSRDKSALQLSLAIGQCMATIAYGQLIAENAAALRIPAQIVSVIFGILVTDLAGSAMQLAALPEFDAPRRERIAALLEIPQTAPAEWDLLAERVRALAEG